MKPPIEINPVFSVVRVVSDFLFLLDGILSCVTHLYFFLMWPCHPNLETVPRALLFSAILPFLPYDLTAHLLQLFNSPKDLVTQNDGNKVVLFFDPRLLLFPGIN